MNRGTIRDAVVLRTDPATYQPRLYIPHMQRVQQQLLYTPLPIHPALECGVHPTIQ